MRLVPVRVLAVLIALAMANACRGTDDEAGSTTRSSVVTPPAPLELETPRTLMDLLGRIPDVPAARRTVIVSRVARGAEVLPLHGLVPAPTLVGLPAFAESELGIDSGGVERYAMAGEGGISAYSVIVGRFDPARMAEAIARHPQFGPISTVNSYADAEFYAWGSEPAGAVDFSLRSDLRALGRGNRLYVSPTELWWVETTPAMQEMIDAATERRPAMRDDPHVSWIATQLDRLGADVAVIQLDIAVLTKTLDEQVRAFVFGVDPKDTRSQLTSLGPHGAAILHDYSMAAVGMTAEGSMLVLLALASNELATENAEQLRRVLVDFPSRAAALAEGPSDRYASVFDVVEIATEGSYVRATLRAEDDQRLAEEVLFAAIAGNDNLLWRH